MSTKSHVPKSPIWVNWLLVALLISHVTMPAAAANVGCWSYTFPFGYLSEGGSSFYQRYPAGATCTYPGPMAVSEGTSISPPPYWRPPAGSVVECDGKFLPFTRYVASVYVIPGRSIGVPGTISLSADGIIRFSAHWARAQPLSQCQNSVPNEIRLESAEGYGEINVRTLEYRHSHSDRSDVTSGRVTSWSAYWGRGTIPNPSRSSVAPTRALHIESARTPGLIVGRVAADGLTEVVLSYRTSDPSAATLAVQLPTQPDFRPSVILDDQTLSLAQTADGRFPLEGRVAFRVAPPNWQSGSPVPININVTQGGITTTTTIEMVAPPVLAIHGVWSRPGSWERLEELRRYLPVADIYAIDYERYHHVSFSSPQVQEAVRAQIQSRRTALRESGLAFTQFNVIGHSMGALVARAYANHPGYVSAENNGRGEFGLLVSVGSPMKGSPLAQALADNAGAGFPLCVNGNCSLFRQLMCAASQLCNSGAVTLADVLRVANKRIDCEYGADCAAVKALSPGSAPLETALAPIERLAYVGIRGVAPESSTEERVLNAITFPVTLTTLDTLFQSTEGGHPPHPEHDTIVGYLSQNDGARRQVDVQNLFHAQVVPYLLSTPTETNSPEVMRQAACFLINGSACVPTRDVAKSVQFKNASLLDEVLTIDLANRQEIDQDALGARFENPALVLGVANRLLMTPTAGTIERIFIQVEDGGLASVLNSNTAASFTPRDRAFKASGVVLLSGLRYARFLIEAPVALPTSAPLFLQVEPASLVIDVGTSVPLTLVARYSNSSADVSSLATGQWIGGSPARAQLSDGIITASSVGSGVLRVEFGGTSRDVQVTVVDPSALFIDSFERR